MNLELRGAPASGVSISALRSAHRDQQGGAENDAIPGERRETVRLDVNQQPFHGSESHDGRRDERQRERAPILAACASSPSIFASS